MGQYEDDIRALEASKDVLKAEVEERRLRRIQIEKEIEKIETKQWTAMARQLHVGEIVEMDLLVPLKFTVVWVDTNGRSAMIKRDDYTVRVYLSKDKWTWDQGDGHYVRML